MPEPVPANYRQIPVRHERVLLLACDPHLPAANLSEARKLLVASDRECALVGYEGRPPRIPMRSLVSLAPCRELTAFAPTVAVVNTLRSASSRVILAAGRYGVRRFFLVDASGSFFEVNFRGALHLVTRRALERRAASLPGSQHLERLLRRRLNPPWPSVESTRIAAEEICARARARELMPLPRGKLRIVHLLGTLGPGGAERQLTYVVEGTIAAGHEVEVWVTHSLEGACGHYLPRMRELGVKVRPIERGHQAKLRPEFLDRLGLPAKTLEHLEEHFAAGHLLPLIRALVAERPDVLHCWLDHTNLTGGLSGLVAQVPRIVLSARNVSPYHVPRLLESWFRETYQELATCPPLILVANSYAGADDYAEWTETERGLWSVVTNGFDVRSLAPMGAEERAAARARLGVAPDDFLVVGVFRLASEKRPHDFLQVVEQLATRIPNLRVIHVGTGPMSSEVTARAAELQLGETLTFVGRQSDPWEILGAADASLLTSDIEGLPNVSLESQALQIPMVLTRAGGAPESVEDGVTGYVCEIGASDEICARLEELAADPDLRRRLGEAGRKWVADAFSVQKMIEKTLALYR